MFFVYYVDVVQHFPNDSFLHVQTAHYLYKKEVFKK